MKPVRILYTWEWGAGYGHLGRLLPLALRLNAQGHQIVLAVKDPVCAQKVFHSSHFSILQGPQLPALRQRKCQVREPACLAGLSWNLGMHDVSSLHTYLGRWHDLITAVNPTHVISDLGLIAPYVSRSLGIPTARIGTGFGNPPRTNALAGMAGRFRQKSMTSRTISLRP